ncbi:MAG: hypothetical protein PQJ58_14880 [Spirochaetales bacterium]|nr:hypothetical protein [Spirochaetales bacterium]
MNGIVSKSAGVDVMKKTGALFAKKYYTFSGFLNDNYNIMV